ncbi:sigma-70 family RNA polymerase sigma factor [Streptomyces sp. NPDC002952]|uniref:sigma-70 family RNA polymerase sigma factor n=1 Tax=Streptomyces sp. NPDC002952 TaxID=3364673 RepID=UPI00368A1675
MSSQANAKIDATGGPATAALVVRAAAGDRDAFAALYNEHQRTVYRFLYFRTRNKELAEDLTQETFIRALRRISTFTERPLTGGFGAWLATIARNLHADHVKSSRFRLEVPVGELFDGDDRCGTAEASALRELEAVEAAEIIAAAMTALTPYQQECVRLRYLEELSLDETVAVMEKPTGAVKTLTFRAIASLRRALVTEELVA